MYLIRLFKGVQILVFPEDGIYGFDYTRKGIQSYLEHIPNPAEETWNPCKEPDKYPNTEIQRNLSCMSSSNNMYIVANMGDYQSCDNKTDPKCPSDGHYQFNTNVVYSPNGTLIARYHKTHLFYEPQFDPAPSTEHIFFETPFGRFGVFICFDILFKNPAIDLIEKYNISNFAYSAAWWDTIFKSASLLSAAQFHSAFAMGMKVNLLAANIQLPEDGFHGSGIYTPDGYKSYYYNTKINETKLLVADLQSVKIDQSPNKRIDHTIKASTALSKIIERHSKISTKASDTHYKNNFITQSTRNVQNEIINTFNASVINDTYTFILLKESGGSITVCNNNLCCHLDYQMMQASGNLVAFGAFDSLHTHNATLYLQVCILLECASSEEDSCGKLTESSNLYFREFRITGNFTSKYTFPEVLVSNAGQPSLASGQLFDYQQGGALEVINGLRLPLISAGLLSRDYSRD